MSSPAELLRSSSAFVFGSVANGTEDADSDIDLMVIGEISLSKVSSLLSTVGNRLGREINPHVMSSVEFCKRVREKDHFVTSVLATPKIFVEGSENVLEGMGS
jgi:predicted nucleotidyltransferase